MWPVILEQSVILFDGGVSLRSLQDGKVKWERKDLAIRGLAQPEIREGVVYLQVKEGLIAIDSGSGKTLWTCPEIRSPIARLAFSGKHLYAATAEKGWFSTSSTLSQVDPASGRVVWSHDTDTLLGTPAEGGDVVLFSVEDRLIALDAQSGSVRFKKKLPWEDEFSPHLVMLRDGAVAVVNEWNVALWNREDGELIYHHAFTPLCPIITTRERMLEQKRLGAKVNSINAGAATYSSSLSTSHYEASFHQAMNSYRSTQDSRYLSQADMYRGLSRSQMGIERAFADMGTSQAFLELALATEKSKLTLSHGLVYPAIDAVIKGYRAFDTGEYVVRLVAAGEGRQEFAALEFLHILTGKRKRIILSPSQMPAGLVTIGSARLSAHDLNGYLPAAPYLAHNYSYAVDFNRMRIYYYGAGLKAEEYVYYGDTDFIRGRLRMMPLELATER